MSVVELKWRVDNEAEALEMVRRGEGTSVVVVGEVIEVGEMLLKVFEFEKEWEGRHEV